MKGLKVISSRVGVPVLACLALLGPTHEARAGLIINANFVGGDVPADLAGGGNLVHIFTTAVSRWEAAFTDPGDRWVVNLNYGWGPLGGGINGQFFIGDQGGTPHRIQSGGIVFNNTSANGFFADATPRDNSEYADYSQSQFDTPEGPLVIGRVFTGATGLVADRVDLLSVALHEIGHALGLAQDNTAAPSSITLGPPLPFAGEYIPSIGADHLSLAGALMNPLQDLGTRYLISPVDILVEAQISQFARPNLDPYAVPEPGSLGLATLGLMAVAARLTSGRRPR